MALRQIYLHTGSLDRMLKMCMEYNHILPFLAAVGLFGVFCGMRLEGKPAVVVNRIAPYTLGVYLLHENLGLRYTWQKWLGAERVDSVGQLLLWTMTAVLCVFLCGIIVDMVRKRVFGIVHRGLSKLGLYRRMAAGLEKADEIFRREFYGD